MIELTMLPARQGDAIWIRWGDNKPTYQMLIDLGTEQTGKSFRSLLQSFPENKRKFELLVVSHVDQDHIGGILTGIAEAEPIIGFDIKDVWFNGWTHLSGGQVQTSTDDTNRDLEGYGAAQGERLAKFLRSYKWNNAFEGKPVIRQPENPPPTIELTGGLKLTVIGPTPERLEEFKDTWKQEVEEALAKGRLTEVSPGLESFGSSQPPVLDNLNDLRSLAEQGTGLDTSYANGSSISLLLEHKDTRLLLSGDAFADDLISGLNALSPDAPLKLDAFKLPHHGSKKNITQNLVQSVQCEKWLFSTDGTRFKHPDAVAVARVILNNLESNSTSLFFNVPSTYNKWWENTAWQKKYNYEATYGTKETGLTINL